MTFLKTLGNTALAVASFLSLRTEVCYNGLGCFKNADPFNNANGKLPQSPADIAVRFLLYTRRNRITAQTIQNSKLSIGASRYSGSKKTKIIIHGYRDNGRVEWIREMTAAILRKEDVNVIAVDWKRGADELLYSQAAANTRVVGVLTAQLMKGLVAYKKASHKNMHLIGHSLGAHVAGYAGRRAPGTGRITGLDPAGPFFDEEHYRVRLDPNDAAFVDVIHTDGEPITTLGFGTRKRLGDVDFYPNGGKNQPGCKPPGKVIGGIFTGKIKEFTRGLACSHSRAIQLFIESIPNTCVFTAHPCTSYSDFQKGRCPCRGKCVAMGYHASSRARRGSYYLKTNTRAPYCKRS